MALPQALVIDPSGSLIIGGSALSLAAAGTYHIYSGIKNKGRIRMEQSKRIIQEHVRHELRLGNSLALIKQKLINNGHPERHVREVVGALELYHYVYHNMKKGYSAVRIKQALLHWGWSEEQVNKTILDASNRIMLQRYGDRHITV